MSGQMKLINHFLTFSFCSLYWSACLRSSSNCINSSLIFFSNLRFAFAASILSWASAESCSSKLPTFDSRAAEEKLTVFPPKMFAIHRF